MLVLIILVVCYPVALRASPATVPWQGIEASASAGCWVGGLDLLNPTVWNESWFQWCVAGDRDGAGSRTLNPTSLRVSRAPNCDPVCLGFCACCVDGPSLVGFSLVCVCVCVCVCQNRTFKMIKHHEAEGTGKHQQSSETRSFVGISETTAHQNGAAKP